MVIFRFFKMAAVCHVRFLKVWNVNLAGSEAQYISPCRILYRSVKPLRRYGRLRSSRWQTVFKMAAVRHLVFFNSKFYTVGQVWRANVHHRAKFCAGQSKHCRDMANFRFFQVAAVHHLGFVLHIFVDHPRGVLGGLCDCAKFGWNRCSNFDNIQVLIFCALSWKMPIHAPKIVVLGILLKKWGAVWERPQKGLPCMEARRMTVRHSMT